MTTEPTLPDEGTEEYPTIDEAVAHLNGVVAWLLWQNTTLRGRVAKLEEFTGVPLA